MDGEVREISERLALVERSMRRYRAALTAVTVIAVAGFAGPSLVGAAKTPAEIQAKRFAVVDDNGSVRAILGNVGDLSGIFLYDKTEKTRAELAVGVGYTHLYLFDDAGKNRAALGYGGDKAILFLTDHAGKPRAVLDTSDDDTSLFLADKAGNNRAALGNFDLQSTATGSTEHRASSSLVLLNEQGRVLWEAP
jgi:hypothetical protein